MRILIPEASSLSARQAITALGLKGYVLEVCDPEPLCIGRFSRFVRRFHRCPGLGLDPEGFLAFVLDLVSRERFDVLLPTHEQAFLFSRVQERLLRHVSLALPSFESYARAHSKAEFSRLLTELDLPQPRTELVASVRELLQLKSFPFVIKMAIGTASRTIWIVRNAEELERAAQELEAINAFEGLVLVQELIDGVLERAQAVFCRGRLVGFHAYRQILEGAGGGDVIKESTLRPVVRSHLMSLGHCLDWHGALSVDYLLRASGETPLYIDCNPRLVEPINALLSGLDLADLLVRVSLGESPPAEADDRAGTRTHMAIQALLRCAVRGGSRLALLIECWRLVRAKEPYSGSREELTPLGWDWLSAIPLLVVLLRLLASPASAVGLSRRTSQSHQLNLDSVRVIHTRIDPTAANSI